MKNHTGAAESAELRDEIRKMRHHKVLRERRGSCVNKKLDLLGDYSLVIPGKKSRLEPAFTKRGYP